MRILKKIGRIILKSIAYFFLFILSLILILSIPFVQTKLGNYATKTINKDFETNIKIHKIDLSFLGRVKLKGVEVKDHKNDSLIYINHLKTSLLNAKKVLENEVFLKDITLDGVELHITTYKGEVDDNLSQFIDKFDDGKPRDPLSNPFLLFTSNLYLHDLHVKLKDFNSTDVLQYEVFNAGGNLQNFKILGPDFTSNIKGLYFREMNGLQVQNLTTDFTYSKTAMHFTNTTLQTQNSNVVGDIHFNYKREDLADFNNKVQIDANFKNSTLAAVDLNKISKEIQGSDVITFNGVVKGTLNELLVQNLDLQSQNGIVIAGNYYFKNLFDDTKGLIFRGDIVNNAGNYQIIQQLLPNVVQKNIPLTFAKFGNFNLKGKVDVTPTQIKANITLKSALGLLTSNLRISNFENLAIASYDGKIQLTKFRVGKLFDDPLFGTITLRGEVNGSGFELENINTSFMGDVEELNFKGYAYNNISANGIYQNNRFDGELKIDDENIKMEFSGLADLSSEVYKFDFISSVDYLDLKNTNLFTRDSIAKIKGNFAIDIEGNTFDDILGNAVFKDVVYTNNTKEFYFEEFTISSSVKDSIKSITVESIDIINGFISGKFIFSELPRVAQNALGSYYTNFKPYAVTPHQYVDFNFTIYNQIVTAFFPDIIIDDNTRLRGKVTADKNQFRLNFSSPKIELFGNVMDDVSLRSDNQNPLYNTFLSAESIKTKYYDLTKFILLNRTSNDTLFFKSVFKGGELKNEDFNLDFYYTINQDNNSILGFEKSTFIYKNTAWNIEPNKEKANKIVFNLTKDEYDFRQFQLTAKDQKIEFSGNLKGDTEKKIIADFTNVRLSSFLPEIDSLKLRGRLSGTVDFAQQDSTFSPEAILFIKDFEVNKFKQGDLSLSIKGKNSFRIFDVDLSIQNENVRSIAATGDVDFSKSRPVVDLHVYMEDFQLSAFSPLGQDVLSSLRGSVYGDFTINGFLGNPVMDGILTVSNAGLKFPYLNVDYNFLGDFLIIINDRTFFFNEINLQDTKYKSTGILKGNITHNNLEKWFFDMNIKTNNLLVLDTENSDDALYYGTAFMDGAAAIYGLADQLTIDVNAKTNPNTVFVVPLKDVETVDNFNLIHFKTDGFKLDEKQKELAQDAIKGLSLNIDLEVTKEAKAQIVIDEISGSQLSGNGEGNLKIELNTRGKFNMFGDYVIEKGTYDFKYGGIISRAFDIQKGSSIAWDGDPLNANLEITAVYRTKANPGVLLQNYTASRNIDVDLVTRITGGLFNSRQDLDIRLNNVDPTIANELDFVINDNNVNQKTTQFISLLATGTFVNPDRVNFNTNSFVAGTASNAISAAFSNLLNSPDSKFKLGVGYQQNNNNLDRINMDDQVDVSLSTQVSDRVIINGKVGVPVGSQTQSSVVGEVKIEILLNKDGSFRGVIFNRQNQIQFAIEEEGYTQGVGLSYQVNFNSLSNLLSKFKNKKKKQNKQ